MTPAAKTSPARRARLERRVSTLVAVLAVLDLTTGAGIAADHTVRGGHHGATGRVAAGPVPAAAPLPPPAPRPAGVLAAIPAAALAVPPAPAEPFDVVAPSTVLAAPKGTIATYQYPGGPQNGTVGTWYTYSLVLPVLQAQGDWLLVRLPQRPNGTIAWVQAGDVSLSSTPYHIVVHLGLTRLYVYDASRRVMAFPAGIGVPATPTVTGDFFVTVRAPAPNAGYGPFVLSTSAHSDAITDWEGLGDAIIAIHGPISSYADGLIGATGARVSNGCVRLHDGDLAHLSVIPAGTPVDIVA